MPANSQIVDRILTQTAVGATSFAERSRVTPARARNAEPSIGNLTTLAEKSLATVVVWSLKRMLSTLELNGPIVTAVKTALE